MSCTRGKEFLANAELTPEKIVDAKKEKIPPKVALELVRSMNKLVVAKGQKLLTLDLRSDAPSDEDLLALIIGPSGNLRAPALQLGKTLVVGFHDEGWRRLLLSAR